MSDETTGTEGHACTCKHCGKEMPVVHKLGPVSKAMADRTREWAVCMSRYRRMSLSGDWKQFDPLFVGPIPESGEPDIGGIPREHEPKELT